MQFYIDPSRENDKWSLPDGEVFYAEEGDWQVDAGDGDSVNNDAGWYWWCCLPGCMPDSEPTGPYDTEEEAIAEAREMYAE